MLKRKIPKIYAFENVETSIVSICFTRLITLSTFSNLNSCHYWQMFSPHKTIELYSPFSSTFAFLFLKKSAYINNLKQNDEMTTENTHLAWEVIQPMWCSWCKAKIPLSIKKASLNSTENISIGINLNCLIFFKTHLF